MRASAAGGFTWTQVRVANVVRARKFEVVHDKGIRIELACTPDGDGHIELSNAAGTRIIHLCWMK